jgi:hypothetical protein
VRLPIVLNTLKLTLAWAFGNGTSVLFMPMTPPPEFVAQIKAANEE